jgi:diguanylate cyclase (GGDEF)-like protein
MGISGPHRASRRFALQVVVPIGVLLGATMAALSAVTVWTALEQDRYALETSRRLAGTAFAVAREAMARSVVDYAVWDDAVRHLVLTLDEAWAADNLETLRKAAGGQSTFAIDGTGRTVYSLDEDGLRSDRAAEAYLTGGLGSLLREARAQAGEGVTGFVDANGTPVLAAAAAVLPHTAEVARPDGPLTVLLAVDRLDDARLREIGELYLLRDLRLADAADGAGLLSLATAGGGRVGGLVWQPDRPGTELLRRLVPALAALSLGLGLGAVLVLRHARQVALIIHESERRAATDALTGLPNRVLLRDRIGQALARLRRNAGEVGVLYLDLDGFKTVNDTHGHAAGDALLRLVADRLRGCVRESDTLARLGGDEFVILLGEPSSAEDAAACARRAAAALALPFQLAEATVAIGVSIGIAMAQPATSDADALLRAADRALYRAKQEGRGTWRLADQAGLPGAAAATA